MATAVYPAHARGEPNKAMLSSPAIAISKFWSAELRPLDHLQRCALPARGVTVSLILAVKLDGTGLREVEAPGYERQMVEFVRDRDGRPTSNSAPVVFDFEDQPTSPIPLIGLFIDGRLVMRGPLTRVIVPPIGVNVGAAQMRFELGAMRLRGISG